MSCGLRLVALVVGLGLGAPTPGAVVVADPSSYRAALAQLEPVQFNYRSDDSETYVGFIAEDVPELVANKDRSSLSPMDIVAVLTSNADRGRALVAAVAPRLGVRELPCPEGCNTVLDSAVITPSEARDPELVARLDAVAGRVLRA